MRELIIERPQYRSKSQKFGQSFLTLAIWAVFLYLIRPLLTIFAWFLGFSLLSETMIEQGGWHTVVEMLGWYAVVVVAIAAALVGWSLLNLLRFRGKERRRQAPAVELAEMADRFEIEPTALARWRRSQVMEIVHDEEGKIVRIHLLSTRPSYPSAAEPSTFGQAVANTM